MKTTYGAGFNHLLHRSAIPGVLAVALAGCATLPSAGSQHDASSAKNAAKTQLVKLDFMAVAGDQAISCGDKVHLGSPQAEATLADLRFYVTHLNLIRVNGERVPVSLANDGKQIYADDQGGAVALIDLENNQGGCMSARNSDAIHSSITGTAPQGRYVGVSFDVGVPNSLNHIDTTKAPAPLDIAAMAWSWQAGKKYLKAEFIPTDKVTRPATDTAPASSGEKFMVHLGATGCEGNPAAGEAVTCARTNIMPVMLTDFNPSSQAIGIDVAALLDKTDIRMDKGGAMGCMSAVADPECPNIFRALGIDLQTGKAVGQQQLFRPVPKTTK